MAEIKKAEAERLADITAKKEQFAAFYVEINRLKKKAGEPIDERNPQSAFTSWKPGFTYSGSGSGGGAGGKPPETPSHS